MGTENLIIGRGYNVTGLIAFDSESGKRTFFPESTYKIVTPPHTLHECIRLRYRGNRNYCNEKFIIVADERTKRHYLVVWIPARVCEVKEAAPVDNTIFIEKIRDIKNQLENLFKSDPVKEKCSVVFLASQSNGDGKISGFGFIGGMDHCIIDNMILVCKNQQILHLFRRAVSAAMIHNFKKGGK